MRTLAGGKLEGQVDRGQEMLDRTLFEQAAGNVLSNALKYGADGTPVKARLSRDAGTLTLVVANQGLGIPADETGRITEAFFRARNTGNVTGVGLGLSIAARAMKDHCGSLEIESSEGEGATVTMKFAVSDTNGGSEA